VLKRGGHAGRSFIFGERQRLSVNGVDVFSSPATVSACVIGPACARHERFKCRRFSPLCPGAAVRLHS